MHNQPVVSRMILHWNLSRTGQELSQNRFFSVEKPVVPFFVKVKMSSNSDQTVAAALIPLASAWLETFCIKYLSSSVVFRGGWQVTCFLAVAITGETSDWRTGKNIYIYIIAVSRLLCNTNKQVSSLPSYYIFLLCWTDAKGRKTQFIWIWSCFLLGGRYGRVISKEPLQIAHLYPMSVWKVLKAKTYWMRCNLFHIFIQLSWNTMLYS